MEFTVLNIVGTRPEAIKMAPVIRELRQQAGRVRSLVCSTGQHREMLPRIFALFDIRPDVELDMMTPDQSLSELTARLLKALDEVVRRDRPDWMLAQGDTTTVLAASLVAFYRGIPFGHVEAGLRTGNLQQPFPEELNRRVADLSARLLFAPTERSRQALLAEGVPPERIAVTGNTAIDALQHAAALPYDWSAGPLAGLPTGKRLVLVTAHRRESFGEPLGEICRGVRELALRHANDVHFVCPVHPNPNVRGPVQSALAGLSNVSLLEPLDYLSLVQLLKRCVLVLTDSGGLQEEAPSLGVPVLVMRDTTERPEGLDVGVSQLVGANQRRIVDAASRLLSDETARAAMSKIANPYGDGRAAQRIVARLLATPGEHH